MNNKHKSDERLPLVTRNGLSVIVNFNEAEEKDDMKSVYTYCQVVFKFEGKLSRDSIIEKLISVKYPTYGAELAAIRGTEDKQLEHTQWRHLAKSTADAVISEVFKT